MKELFDTIAAISTPPGSGGISIVRMSGADAVAVAAKIFKGKDGLFPEINPYQFYYGHVVESPSGKPIDECLLLYMKSPKSYTGEDAIEFHCHGGPVSSFMVLQLLLSHGIRMADPGEFTLRAFLNGKKDLTQAEAVETLVHSQTPRQQENALFQLQGGLTGKLETVIAAVREGYYRLEAAVNFPEDVEGADDARLTDELKSLHGVLAELRDSFFDGKPYFQGIYSIIIGKPNVGKSSFLNKTLEYERAIVSAHPGTTRDFIEEGIIFEGFPLKIVDTAGIRDSRDPVETMGVERSLSLLPRASVVFAVFDVSAPLDDSDFKIISLLNHRGDTVVFALLNKTDLGAVIDPSLFPEHFNVIPVSVLTGHNFEEFKALFRDKILDIYGTNKERDFYLTNPRHYAIVSEMNKAVSELLNGQISCDKLLFTAKEILGLYDNLTGREMSPDEIHKIFDKFCIGK